MLVRRRDADRIRFSRADVVGARGASGMGGGAAEARTGPLPGRGDEGAVRNVVRSVHPLSRPADRREALHEIGGSTAPTANSELTTWMTEQRVETTDVLRARGAEILVETHETHDTWEHKGQTHDQRLHICGFP